MRRSRASSSARLSAECRSRTDAGTRPADARRSLSPWHLSTTTVRYAYDLRIALGRALKSGKVLRNVCTLVDPPAKARVELRPLTADEVGVLLASVAETRDGPLYVLAIGTGLREGELLALRW